MFFNKEKRNKREYIRGRKNGLYLALEPDADLNYLEAQSDTSSWRDDPYDRGFISAIREVMILKTP